MSKIEEIFNKSTLDNGKKPSNTICSTCSLATLIETRADMTIYCGKLFKVMWVSDKKIDIDKCSGYTKAED